MHSQASHEDLMEPGVAITVGGDLGGDLRQRVENSIASVCIQAQLTSGWSIAVAPAPDRGRWTVMVTGNGRKHLFSISCGPDRLPMMLEGRLGAVLSQLSAVVPLAPRRI
jgi:hypothetical protein